MMELQEIKELKSVVLPHIGNIKRIVEYKLGNLTEPGENFGSLMLSVDIKTENNNGRKEFLRAVAKIPPKGMLQKKIFKIPTTFRKELEFYRTILPVLQNFQKEQNVPESLDIFPKFYGGRLSLNKNSQNFDEANAVILMENLKIAGYKSISRKVQYDLDGAKLVLKDLACMHGVPMAMKILKPDNFGEKIMLHLETLNFLGEMGDGITEKIVSDVVKMASEDEGCLPYLDNLRKSLEQSLQNNKQDPNIELIEPFGTMIHTDFWINNILSKFINGKPVKNKFVDFQLIEYGSPARDVLFFILNSVQISVIQKHFDQLIHLYFTALLNILKNFQVDIVPFTMEAFQRNIDTSMNERVLFQCFAMLDPVFASSELAKCSSKAEEDCAGEELSLKGKQRLWFLVKEFTKRKWF